MKFKTTATLAAILFCSTAFPQDSLRVFRHEAGVSLFGLLRQVSSFKPEQSDQLPYTYLYNFYYRKTGIRLGLGAATDETHTAIEGQRQPRVTRQENYYFRGGITHNVSSYKAITVNVFVDYVQHRESLESATTTTVQTFPNPVSTRSVRSIDIETARGVQAGLGLSIRLHRHLALYTESPVTWLRRFHRQEDLLRETGEDDVVSKTVSISSGIKIAIPATVYFLFRF